MPKQYIDIVVPLNFNPTPSTPFNDAVLHVAQMSFMDVRGVRHWSELFPYPDFVSTQQIFKIPGVPAIGKSIREQQLEWERDASYFVQRCQDKIRFNLERLDYLLGKCLKQWEKDKRGITAESEEIVQAWCQKNDMPTAQFYSMFFTIKMAGQFLQEFAEEWRKNRGTLGPPKNRKLYILPSARQSLINDLIPFIEPPQHEDLVALINEGYEPILRIVCYCKQVDIGRIFYEQVKNKGKEGIQADKTVIAQWICRNFLRDKDGKVQEVSEAVIYNYLKGKNFPKRK